jgi:hypothetical protein
MDPLLKAWESGPEASIPYATAPLVETIPVFSTEDSAVACNPDVFLPKVSIEPSLTANDPVSARIAGDKELPIWMDPLLASFEPSEPDIARADFPPI